MKNPRFLIYFSMLLIFGCQQSNETGHQLLKQGIWRATLESGDNKLLPFNFNLAYSGDTLHSIAISNHTEVIEVTEISIKNDSLFAHFPVFNSEIKAKIVADTIIEGAWYDYNRKHNYHVVFRAEYGKKYRFLASPAPAAQDISGKWEVTFNPNTEDAYKAIGKFQQADNHLTGTFLTSTGDYRFLEGVVSNDSLYLSTFDGAHAYLFTALINDTIKGNYYSGNHYKTDWIAVRNVAFELPDPDTLTYLKEGYDRLSFSFPDKDSNMVSLDDPEYEGKVVIVQIMGTWCPNCKDETDFLAGYYEKHQDQGLEIISIAFERTDDFPTAVKNIERLRKKYDIGYDILIGGTDNKQKVNELFPMLNTFLSYPTTIFIDRNGNVRRIHTGFSGPATGEPYEQFKIKFNQLVQNMLNEQPKK